METTHFTVPDALQAYVKDILVIENSVPDRVDSIPFYADGFPGILYHNSKSAPILLPRAKPLTELFLYGQTIKPIIIKFHAPYKVVLVELLPFAVKMIFDVNPRELNDDCYNFLAGEKQDDVALKRQLADTEGTEQQIALLSSYLETQVANRSFTPHQKIKLASEIIISSKGGITVTRLAEQLKFSERSLQRLFKEYVGVSPKQFAKIIQFQASLNDMFDPGINKLTELVYENGFADQSHFIRDFKRYAGTKPSWHKKKSI
ncbi:helix-turn-helix transcriptional regulator [Desertivirga brevis]|uniref:helix-turn-helix transcriptional regulator n=1 Tax=Desertivirga brevis TaxID=2810310 RepID=UPI001A96C13C|nr:helix-turn-helix transcriptional regulator [Pedobacter sp. SYSU D00873]